jgi:single-stranded DNA-binding protein
VISFNRVNLLGVVATVPRERGAAVMFRIRTWDIGKDGRQFNQYHNIDAFGYQKDAALALREDAEIYLEGYLKTSSYEKDGQKVWKTSVVASKIVSQSEPGSTRSGMRDGGSSDGSYPPNGGNRPMPQSHGGQAQETTTSDDQFPF